MIKVIDTNISEVKLIEPTIFRDDRGYFFESYNEKEFIEKIGPIKFIQDNQSKSSYGVLRGLHFQKKPYEQAKLVRVLKGKILDVAVDIRKKSPTYKKYVSKELSDKNNHQLFVPEGFAHGFIVLSEIAIVSYKVNQVYKPDYDSGIIYNDKNLNIDWMLRNSDIVLSDKDQKLSILK